MTKNRTKEKLKKKEKLKTISLYPLEAEEALGDILDIQLTKKVKKKSDNKIHK